jgi:regulator of sirC expression with transglutaminase-like and TPR domain
MLPKGEIQAMISLIDDPDEKVYRQIREKLLSYGEEVIPILEDYWEHHHYGIAFQTRIENIIHQIQFDSVRVGLERWSENGGNNLLEGVILINRYQYPDLDVEKVHKKLNQLKQDIWIELNENLTSFEEIRVVNQILFEIHGFTANKKNYHSASNSYLHLVLETGNGNPLSLSIIYILVCEMLDIPVFGVNLPNHFVLCYQDESNIMKKFNQAQYGKDVMFYINAFSRGTIFNGKEIELFLKQINVEPQESYFIACDNFTIIKRLIANLIYSYEKSGELDKVNELNQLMNCLGYRPLSS